MKYLGNTAAILCLLSEGRPCVFFGRSVRRLRVGQAPVKVIQNGLLCGVDLSPELRGAVFLGPGQHLVPGPPGGLLFQDLPPAGSCKGDVHGGGEAFKDLLFGQESVDCVGLGEFLDTGHVGLHGEALCTRLPGRIDPLPGHGLQGEALLPGQEFTQVCFAAFRVLIQHFFVKFIGPGPVSVLQSHGAPLQQGSDIVALLDHRLDDRLGCRHGSRFRLFVRIHHLADAPDQILDETDLGHIIGLQDAQLLRQVIGVHARVAGEQQLGAVLAHHGQEPAPFVLHPHGGEMLRLRADHHHHLGGVQGGEDIGLILGASHVFQGDPGEEDPLALLGQLVIDILGHEGVPGPLALSVGLLIADEYIVGFRVLGGGEDAPLDLRDLGGVLAVLPLGQALGVFHRRQIVHILQEAVEGGPVAGGEPFEGLGVLHILDAEAAQGAAPVGFRILIVLLNDPLIDRQGLIELADAAEMVAPVEGGCPLVVIELGEGHGGAAEIAGAEGLVLGQGDAATAVLAVDECHLRFLLFRHDLHMVQSEFQTHGHQLVAVASRDSRDVIDVLEQLFGQTHGYHSGSTAVFFGCDRQFCFVHRNTSR